MLIRFSSHGIHHESVFLKSSPSKYHKENNKELIPFRALYENSPNDLTIQIMTI